MPSAEITSYKRLRGTNFFCSGPSPARWRNHLGKNYDLPARFVLFHAAMRLIDLVKVEDLANLDAQTVRRDLLHRFGVCL